MVDERREKIAEYFHTHWYLEHSEIVPHYNSLSKEGKDFYRKMANQISARFPDEEEIRKQERERIIAWGEERCPHSTSFPDTSDEPMPDILKYKKFCGVCWQALEEGKK